mmetsp:Transcript_122372/g.238073  ORF Transcript_122372/g.238073 Transcript_122372/m.238073 type:complete len:130 (+) Transcript_122372:88-477(+)
MPAATDIARNVVAMTESRMETIQREVASEFMDYYVEMSQFQATDACYVKNKTILVMVGNGYLAMTPEQLFGDCHGEIVATYQRRRVLNVLTAHGYQECQNPPETLLQKNRAYFVLKVPRSIALQNMDAM